MPIDSKLIFTRPHDGTGRLVFNDSVETAVQPAEIGVDADFAGDADCSVQLLWDANVVRGEAVDLRSHWQDATPASARTRAHWQPAQPFSVRTASRWQDGEHAGARTRAHWQDAQRFGNRTGARWQAGERLRATARQAWQEAQRLRAVAGLVWQDGTPQRHSTEARYQQALRLRTAASARWQDGAPMHKLAYHRGRAGLPVLVGLATRWQDARRPPAGLSVVTTQVDPGDEPCYDPATLGLLVFSEPWAASDGRLVFVCHRAGVEPPPAQVVVPVRSVYMIINSASLRRVSDNQALPTYATTLTVDAESWTWSFSADMPMDALPLIQRTSPVDPVEVELTINGLPFRALIESVSRNRTFDDWRITVRGRGLGAALDTPYSRERLHYSAVQMTAQQLALDALTVNGVSNGWSLDWQLSDWLVPGNVWSMQGSPIAAVNRIAAAAGGYVQPHPTAKTLRVLPKFPIAPWNWSTLMTPDIELPTGPVSTESVEWVDGSAYNRVFVSGTVAGVIGQVTRGGTAGDALAPMVTDALITTAGVAGARGMSELAKGGRWANITLRLPVLEETGVIVPGKTLRYNDGGTSHLGIARSLSLQDDGSEIWQSIGVASYVA